MVRSAAYRWALTWYWSGGTKSREDWAPPPLLSLTLQVLLSTTAARLHSRVTRGLCLQILGSNTLQRSLRFGTPTISVNYTSAYLFGFREAFWAFLGDPVPAKCWTERLVQSPQQAWLFPAPFLTKLASWTLRCEDLVLLEFCPPQGSFKVHLMKTVSGEVKG